ncbi:MAG: alpha-L-arabinofuranosidase C-terminal domain-containing protein [Tepidisphaeraceae bacterium]|jgi:alpha-L-arabinofuranosidase
MKPTIFAAVTILFGLFLAQANADPGHVNVDVQHPGAKISPTFYGLMTEEINHSYDGGLYAELVQNRAFKDSADQPAHWSLVNSESAEGTIALDDQNPVNATALTTSLRLNVSAIAQGQRVGVANDGFWGIPVWPQTQYRASFYARSADGLAGPLTVDIESNDGATVYATTTVPQIDAQWKNYQVTLSTAKVDPTADARLVISSGSKGTLWLSLVSLFPPTFSNRPNGNRIDLMQVLGDLHPAFLRFPGGNYLEGDTIDQHFAWKNTIGDIAQRPGHLSPWKYRSSDGLGLLEFLDWCEDLHVQPVLAVFAGYALTHQHVDPGPQLEPFVQEALDEIEYCTGDASTKWGQERVKDGHPEPFKIQYVEIGNEDWFDRAGYDGRFTQFYDAIKAKYPDLQLIATAAVKTRTPDVIDDHYYRSSRAMERDVHHYDKTDRKGPKIFVGEWATREGSPTPNFGAAMADAAWLTGLERNSDIVVMNCYAPLFINVNRGANQWGTDLIGYNALTSFGSASYYAQKMFNENMGDTILPVDIAEQPQTPSTPPPAPAGGIGVATWNTQAQFKDVKVTAGDQVLYQSDFSKGTDGWRARGGEWDAVDGALTQTSDSTDCRMTAGDPAWTDYTYSLKAQKTGGSEGFIVMFHARGRNDFIWWNVGGWGNTRSALQKMADGEKSEFGPSAPVTINDNRWYDVRIELKGADVKCYLDDKLITEATDTPPSPVPAVYASASRASATGQLILKVVNVSSAPQDLQVNLQGATDVKADAQAIVLSGQRGDVNTLDEPRKIFPKEADFHDAAASFSHEFPAYSVSVLKIDAKP